MGDKLYYSIGEVARMIDVNPSLLRFWETEFSEIKPFKNKKGTRYYTVEDIELLKRIYHLTRDCGYTLEGVRDQLRTNTKLDEKMQLVKTLNETKDFLNALKDLL